MNWAYLVIILWMVGLLVVALMHDHDLRKGLNELEIRNQELECKLRKTIELLSMHLDQEGRWIEIMDTTNKIMRDSEEHTYGEILNLRDDIREYSKSVEGQMESVGEAQMKVIQAVENLEKDFGSEVISDDEATIIEELMKDYDSQSNAGKAYIDWLRENPGKTHYLDREETFERRHKNDPTL